MHEVERRVAKLDGAEEALLFASGMAALTTAVLALVRAGDHVVLFSDVYRRTRNFVVTTLARFDPDGKLRNDLLRRVLFSRSAPAA